MPILQQLGIDPGQPAVMPVHKVILMPFWWACCNASQMGRISSSRSRVRASMPNSEKHPRCDSIQSMPRVLWLALFCAPLVAQTKTSKTFDIYFIDVEGGHATLYVAPTGES